MVTAGFIIVHGYYTPSPSLSLALVTLSTSGCCCSKSTGVSDAQTETHLPRLDDVAVRLGPAGEVEALVPALDRNVVVVGIVPGLSWDARVALLSASPSLDAHRPDLHLHAVPWVRASVKALCSPCELNGRGTSSNRPSLPLGVVAVVDAACQRCEQSTTYTTWVPSDVAPLLTSRHFALSPFGWMARPVTVGGAEDDEAELEVELEADEELVGPAPLLSALMNSAARSAKP